jgi:ribose transport system ATP-binding protein
VRLASPADAVRHGIGYIPRERRTEGLVLFLSVATNATLASLRALRRRAMIDHGAERRLVAGWVERLRIRTPSIRTLCLNLSGGNQQKVVLAKWLLSEPSIFIMDEPTRGIDVGAKYEIYSIIDRLATDDGGVIFISSELEELLAISDRILVMSQGEIIAEFARAEFDRAKILTAAFREQGMAA